MRMAAIAAAGLLAGLAGCGPANQPAPNAPDSSTAPAAHDSSTAPAAHDSSNAPPGEAAASLAPGAPADFAVCTGCHSIAAGGIGIGPSLRGVVGRKAGSLPGFAYSNALQKSGIMWTPKTLDAWLSGPMTLVPGTKMSFGGYSNPTQRQAVIGYLQTLK